MLTHNELKDQPKPIQNKHRLSYTKIVPALTLFFKQIVPALTLFFFKQKVRNYFIIQGCLLSSFPFSILLEVPANSIRQENGIKRNTN